jgi:integrase
MAYAGLRPGEALALEWDHIGARTILVEQSNSESGPAADTKTKRIRTVRLLEPLAADLAGWRTSSLPPGGSASVFLRSDGEPVTPVDYRNWRRRRFDPVCAAARISPARPYDLRHSFASLMIQAGYSPVELAAELGHSPTLTLNTYAHVFSEFTRGERIDPGATVASARFGI